ncbi:MAG: hypothetical protein IJV56_05000 [Neisseriaceae bacterium]|nr:hypothetical protein [Neisseriaceae bacterium]
MVSGANISSYYLKTAQSGRIISTISTHCGNNGFSSNHSETTYSNKHLFLQVFFCLIRLPETVSGSLFYGDFFMKQVHISANGKGGIGKTLIAIMTSQYLRQYSGKQVFCFDTDPVNPTFSRYLSLNVEIINILNEQNDINKREFDTLVERLIGGDDNLAVVDNGAATFIPLMSYIVENDIIGLLQEQGVEVIFHIPLYGGDAFEDTIQGLATILERLPAIKVVVWLNHNQNKIVFNGVSSFEETKIYKEFANRILGVVELPPRNAETFGVDIKEMTQRHLTVDEIKANSFDTAKGEKKWKLIEMQRINIFYNDICKQLDAIPLFTAPAAKQGKEKADKVEKSTATA